ncbi:unnamed protein product [Darwinula stevensoni]|uniref:E3 SUMO-protein ligase NSE2 n=1 Tax=Darwinula stevensoni TaxID=69355 RepID=A0A7R8X8S8_9CRUS|nr:unnamed protein product [Darwinula stevensoni]CAG0888408.1 unnamed protein product [Darwinula stevensoni]
MENDSAVLKSINEILDSAITSLNPVITYLEGDERNKAVKNLQSAMKHAITSEQNLKTHVTVIKSLQAELKNDPSIDIPKRYNSMMKSVGRKVPKLKEHGKMTNFDEALKSLLRDRQEVVQESLNAEEGSDEEIVMTQSEMPSIDPFSGLTMTDPVRNIICSHIYDRSSVIDVLKRNPQVRCPIPGCGNKKFITLESVVPDNQVKKHLQKMKSQK